MATPHGSKIFMDSATVAPVEKGIGPVAVKGFNGKGGTAGIKNEMATSAPKKDLGACPSGPRSGMAYQGDGAKGIVINPMATIAPTTKNVPRSVTGSGGGGQYPTPPSWEK